MAEVDSSVVVPKPLLSDMSVQDICAFLHGEKRLPNHPELKTVSEFVSKNKYNGFFNHARQIVGNYYWFIQTLSDEEAYELKKVVESVKILRVIKSVGWRSNTRNLQAATISYGFAEELKCSIYYKFYREKMILVIDLKYPKTNKYAIADWLKMKYSATFKLDFPNTISQISELERIHEELLENNPRHGQMFLRRHEIMERLRPFIRRNSLDEDVIFLIKTIIDMITKIVDEPTYVAMTTKSAKF
jgi:hypothetical protein